MLPSKKKGRLRLFYLLFFFITALFCALYVVTLFAMCCGSRAFNVRNFAEPNGAEQDDATEKCALSA